MIYSKKSNNCLTNSQKLLLQLILFLLFSNLNLFWLSARCNITAVRLRQWRTLTRSLGTLPGYATTHSRCWWCSPRSSWGCACKAGQPPAYHSHTSPAQLLDAIWGTTAQHKSTPKCTPTVAQWAAHLTQFATGPKPTSTSPNSWAR